MKGSEDVSGATLLIVHRIAAGRLGAVADTVNGACKFFDWLFRAHCCKSFYSQGPKYWQVRLPKKFTGMESWSARFCINPRITRGSERRRDNAISVLSAMSESMSESAKLWLGVKPGTAVSDAFRSMFPEQVKIPPWYRIHQRRPSARIDKMVTIIVERPHTGPAKFIHALNGKNRPVHKFQRCIAIACWRFQIVHLTPR